MSTGSDVAAAVTTNREARLQLSIVAQYIAQAYGTAQHIGSAAGPGGFASDALGYLFSGLSTTVVDAKATNYTALNDAAAAESALYDSIPDNGDAFEDGDRLASVIDDAEAAISSAKGADSKLATNLADTLTFGASTKLSAVVAALPSLPVLGPIPIWAWAIAFAVLVIYLYRKVLA